jgi:hypothetical protein
MRRRASLIDKLKAEEGLSDDEAHTRAMEIMRDNGRGDWRAG